jgi:guanosine-3',5'-bis(diphosphate) 3'-pyrophosphohydrolase
VIETDLRPWEPRPEPLPETWMALAARLAEQMKGSLRAYVLGVKYNASGVGNLLRSWGLPWEVVMAGHLWEYEEGKQEIRQANLPGAQRILDHMGAADLYARYIEQDTLSPLLTPPYRDLGALLVAVAIYYEALRALAQQSAGQPYRGKKLLIIEGVGHTLLNITKRLGMWLVKREIEDLIEQLHNPVGFAEDRQEHQHILEQSAAQLEQVRHLLKTCYRRNTGQPIEVIYTPCGVAGLKRRVQDAHSTITSEKTQLTGFDLVTFDVIVPTVADCYQAFGVLGQLGHIQDRVSDLIANPKSNGCSHIALGLVLHPRTLRAQGFQPIESPSPVVCQLQIATPIMQAITNYGCLYPRCYQLYTLDAPSLRQEYLQSWSSVEGRTFQAILENFESEWEPTDTPITVYSKDRTSISLPKGATALDFAFAFDPAIGIHAVEAFINNRKAPLYRELNAGDIVEILTSKDIQVQEYWLDKSYVITSNALKNIRDTLSKDSLDRGGYQLLNEALESRDYFLSPEELRRELSFLVKRHKLGTVHEYLERLKAKKESQYTPKWAAQHIIQQVEEHKEKLRVGTSIATGNVSWIAVVDEPVVTKRKAYYRQHFCNSCHPRYPRDTKIMGLLKPNGELVVHKQTCPFLLARANGHHSELLSMSWQLQPPAFEVSFFLLAQDRTGLIYDLTRELRRHQCTLLSLTAETTLKFKEAYISFTIEAYSDEDVLDIREQLRKIESVLNVEINAFYTSRPVYERLQKRWHQRHSTSRTVTVVRRGWEEAIATLQPRNFVLRNLYDISRPASAKMFFGRSYENQFLQRELCEGEHGKAIILYAPRRSGKSSICKNFIDSYVSPPFWGVLFSLQNATQLSEEAILQQLADRIGWEFQKQLQRPAPVWSSYRDSDPQVCFRRFLQDCIGQNPDTRLILALDEFGGALESYDHGTLKRGFFTFWKDLMTDITQLSLIFALPTSSHQTLASKDIANAFSFTTPLPVGFLDEESAERLLVDPLRDQQIIIHPNTVGRTIALTGGHPYFMTLIGQQLVHYLNRDTYKQKVTDEDLDMIVNALIEESGFRQNFDYLTRELQNREELRILESIIALTDDTNQPVQLKKIASHAHLPMPAARGHLERLRSGMILQQSGPPTNPYYAFTISLICRWLRSNHWFFSQA